MNGYLDKHKKKHENEEEKDPISLDQKRYEMFGPDYKSEEETQEDTSDAKRSYLKRYKELFKMMKNNK